MPGPAPESRAVEVEAALRSGALVVPTRRDLLDVSGPDAADYLQGQLTQDVAGLAVGAQARTLLLQPQGKVDAWLRVYRLSEERFLLDLDPGHGEAALARLRRFKLRVACELTLTERPMVAVRGGGATTVALPDEVLAGAVVLDTDWPDVIGFDLMLGGGSPTGGDEATELAVTVAETVAQALANGVGPVLVGTEAELDAIRIGAGVPAMGTELDGSTIPAAAPIVEASVDFTKGCYVGQELVARVDSRGSTTPTRLHRVRFDPLEAGAGPGAGAPIMIDGAEVGRLTSFAPSSAQGPVGLAYIKRGTDLAQQAQVATADGDTVLVELVELSELVALPSDA